MKISTKGKYGLRAMVDLAINSRGEHLALSVIAERQDISVNYLEQVFSILRKAKLVKSIKGPQGGYILADKPSNIKVGDILRVLEGDLEVVRRDENYHNDIEKCIGKRVWQKINESIDSIVDSVSLDDLVNDFNKLSGSKASMYYI